jgi:hypothetical protein
MKNWDNFCVFILTHGRADRVITYETLRNSGYDGPIKLIIDDEDKKGPEYVKRFGDEVYIFNKKESEHKTDTFDRYENRGIVVYARNECFDIAEKIGVTYFLMLDDDYPSFKFRINDKFRHPESCPNMRFTLGDVIYATLQFYKSTNIDSVAFSQGGDWFGGEAQFGKNPKRKIMNSFFLSTERKFKFMGRVNEDVNAYVWLGSQGRVFFTIPFIQLDQFQTQSNSGGLTDIYLQQGTFVKSFYTVMCAPSCTSIVMMGRTNRRLHHKIDWSFAVPMIIDEKYKKNQTLPSL